MYSARQENIKFRDGNDYNANTLDDVRRDSGCSVITACQWQYQ